MIHSNASAQPYRHALFFIMCTYLAYSCFYEVTIIYFVHMNDTSSIDRIVYLFHGAILYFFFNNRCGKNVEIKQSQGHFPISKAAPRKVLFRFSQHIIFQIELNAAQFVCLGLGDVVRGCLYPCIPIYCSI